MVDDVSGKKTKRVLEETPVRNALTTLGLLLLFSALAFFIWLCTMPLLGALVARLIPGDGIAVFRTQFTILIYSYCVVRFNKVFGQAAATIVKRENLKYMKEHEESMVIKTYVLGFVNSYLGMLAACFFFRKLSAVCILLSIVLAMKQFVMNAIKIWEPKKKGAIEHKFKEHEPAIRRHFNLYDTEYSSNEERKEHEQAERQLLMGPMPPMLVGQYNELVIQLGWVLFFSLAFPFGAFFCIFSAWITVGIELKGMGEYKAKDKPAAALDIGLWLDLLEFCSAAGIGLSVYIIIYASKQLQEVANVPASHAIIAAFVFQHVLFGIKVLLGEVIDDVPGWVADDAEQMENRVLQA